VPDVEYVNSVSVDREEYPPRCSAAEKKLTDFNIELGALGSKRP
jgi:hypothetical protein